MGSCVGRCKTENKSGSLEIADAGADAQEDKKKKRKQQKDDKKSKTEADEEIPEVIEMPFQWELELLENKLVKSGLVKSAAVVDAQNGTFKASCPKEFVPNAEGVKNILAALNGDTSGLAENGLVLGDGELGSFTPGKLDDGKAIYASNGQESGCVVYKTSLSVLIAVYDKNPDAAIRVTSEAAEYMVQNDR